LGSEKQTNERSHLIKILTLFPDILKKKGRGNRGKDSGNKGEGGKITASGREEKRGGCCSVTRPKEGKRGSLALSIPYTGRGREGGRSLLVVQTKKKRTSPQSVL